MTAEYTFPPVASADPQGLVCLSEDLTPLAVLAGYRHGVFPWTDEPVGWFAPPQRGVLLPQQAHFPRNLPRLMRRAGFSVRCDTAFAEVIANCRAAHRSEGEWITDRFVRAYCGLAALGHAHSIEIWQDNALVGGAYGVQTGRMFAAESMFGWVDNASKAAVHALVRHATALGIALIDVQVLNPVTAQFGAIAIPRQVFGRMLQACLQGEDTAAPRRWPSQL